MQYVFKWNLYSWGDRAYEDCIALVTVEVPDTWKTIEPTEEQLTVVSVVLEPDTEKYLKGTYRTDIGKLTKDLTNDVNSDDILEDMAEYGDADWA